MRGKASAVLLTIPFKEADMGNIICEKSHFCFGGVLGYYRHESVETSTTMRFSLFQPAQNKAQAGYMIFLSGLTCTEETFATKACAYQKAATLGLTILAPDTSPRGDDVANHDDYDLGQGAGFYLDATQAPWAKHFRMESYLIKELLPQCETHFNLDASCKTIAGHSMGGHGALTLYYKYPNLFRACSVFAPIVAPSQVPWGKKVFSNYLGDNQEEWKKHDASCLVRNVSDAQQNAPILMDQGLADNFLQEQLQPELFAKACDAVGQELILRQHEDYDHGYFFIQSFINDHLEFHAKYIR